MEGIEPYTFSLEEIVGSVLNILEEDKEVEGEYTYTISKYMIIAIVTQAINRLKDQRKFFVGVNKKDLIFRRKAMGISQAQAARYVGVSRVTYNKFEKSPAAQLSFASTWHLMRLLYSGAADVDEVKDTRYLYQKRKLRKVPNYGISDVPNHYRGSDQKALKKQERELQEQESENNI